MFLSKPVKLQELNNILQSIFGSAQSPRTGVPAKPEIRRLTESASILVAEDEPVNMLLITEVLHKMGFTVIKASNGKQVLDLLDTHQPAVILMDVNMPEMDGYETMQVIRQNPSFRRLPIIALTAKAMKGDREKCLEAGASEYLAKPVNTEQLLSALRMWLHR